MRSRATIRWVGLALVGLLIAAGVAVAASRLASQQIGLASEPIEAGNALAPAAVSKPHEQHSKPQNPSTVPAQTTPTTPSQTPAIPTAPTPTPTVETPPTEGGDDHSGDHGGHGADD
jgi:outer membrane biosynthesis protein TonB